MKHRTIGSNQSVLTFRNGTSILFSYETPCAAFIPGEGYKRTADFVSRTTQRHIATWIGNNPSEVVPQSVIVSLIGSAAGKHEDDGNEDAA